MPFPGKTRAVIASCSLLAITYGELFKIAEMEHKLRHIKARAHVHAINQRRNPG